MYFVREKEGSKDGIRAGDKGFSTDERRARIGFE